MDRLMKPAEVAEALGYRDMNRVREIMRSMVHMEGPLRVSEKALEGWVNGRTLMGMSSNEQLTMNNEQLKLVDRIPRRKGGKGA